MVNETYEKTYEVDISLEDVKQMMEEEDAASSSEETENNEENLSIGGVFNSLKDKADNVVDAVSGAAEAKIDELEVELNKIMEGVAVMLVTTCAIPILVMIAFELLLKGAIVMQIPLFNVQAQRKKKSSEPCFETTVKKKYTGIEGNCGRKSKNVRIKKLTSNLLRRFE